MCFDNNDCQIQWKLDLVNFLGVGKRLTKSQKIDYFKSLIKMESTLFVPVNLSFSENLRCLKMPLLVGAISQKRWPSETCFVFAGQNVNSGKFKHLKYSENVKFTGTNYIDSILVNSGSENLVVDFFFNIRKSTSKNQMLLILGFWINSD